MYRYNTIQYNTIQPYFRLNLSVLDIHLTGVSDSPEGTNRQLLCRTYALSDHFNCSPLNRRQSWGLGCRDTPEFGLGSSEGSQGASWTGRETLLYLSFIYSFIHSGHFYSAPSSPLLLRGAPDYSTDTVSEFHAEAHMQLQVKDLPKVPTWRLKRESNPRPSG